MGRGALHRVHHLNRGEALVRSEEETWRRAALNLYYTNITTYTALAYKLETDRNLTL